MDRCWILVGMMGAGKSSVGKRLGELSGRPLVDTDLLLQRRFGRPVSQIFKIYGEEAFRGHETSILRDLQPTACILSTGGGIVLRDENWTEMRRLGVSVYLKVDEETLASRLAASKKRRPLLEVDDWEARLKEIATTRADRYSQADLTVDLNGLDLDQAAKRVLASIGDWERGGE